MSEGDPGRAVPRACCARGLPRGHWATTERVTLWAPVGPDRGASSFLGECGHYTMTKLASQNEQKAVWPKGQLGARTRVCLLGLEGQVGLV